MKVIVIGGGPAGMIAAINAAESIALDPDCNDSKGDAAKVHAILEGEV